MNKIYRRLWSAARQCWVVASELVAARGTRRHTSRGPGLALVLAMLPASVMAATAGHLETGADEWMEDALYAAFGPFNASAMLVHEDAATAPSGRAFSRANALPLAYSDFVQLGSYAGALNRAVAVGVWAHSNNYGVALGYQANANGQHATALGHQAVAWEIGSVAVGNDAKSYGYNAIALGSGALAAGRNSIVLGADSNDYGDNQVSVGNGGTRRKIVYVADGAVDANSSEVVTGRQLHATQQALASVSQSQTLLATGTAPSSANAAKAIGSRALAIGVEATADGEDTLALGGGARTAPGSGVARIAIGAGAFAGSSGWTGAVALGGSASSTHDGVAIGYQAKTSTNGTVALGRGAIATHGNSVALGSNSVTSGANSVSVGSSSNRRKIQYLADGVIAAGSTDAITGNQLHATNALVATATSNATTAKTIAENALGTATSSGYITAVGTAMSNANKAVASGTGAFAAGTQAKVQGTHASAFGFSAQATATQATALGRESAASGTYSTAVGNLAKAGSASAVALGDRTSATHANAVALGAGSVTAGANTISVGNSSNRRKIQYLADGVIAAGSTDAITGNQLHATNQDLAAAQAAAQEALRRARATNNLLATAAEVSEANKATATGNLAMAMGNAAKGNGVAAIALGNTANAVGTNAIAVGSASSVTAHYAVALGGNAKALHDNAVALGEKSVTTGTSQVSVGNATLKRKLVNVADAALSNTSTDAVTGKQLFAVDEKVTANQSLLTSHASQISGHQTRIADNRRDLDALRTEFDNFDPDLEGVVRYAADGSIDLDGGKVRGVAAGDISSASSTDAVNGGQLFAANEKILALESVGKFVSIGIGGSQRASAAGVGAVAIGDSAEATVGGEGGVAIGAFSRAVGKNSIAIGRAAYVAGSAEGGFALGVGTSVNANRGVALGAESQVQAGANNSVAVGYGSIASEPDTVSFGNDSIRRRLTGVSRGLGDAEAVAIVQLSESLSTLGGGARLSSQGGVIAPVYNVQGGTQSNVGDALAILDGAVLRADSRVDGVEGQLRATFQQSPSTSADGIGQLNLAGAQGMILSNLVDGRIDAGSRDAVTGSQLYAAKQEIARNGDEIERMKGMSDKGVRYVLQQALDERGGPIDFAGSRLTGIDLGDISSAFSTDAVNGSQLYVTNQRIASVESTHRFFKIGRDDLSEDAKAGSFGVAIGESAQATPKDGGEGGTAVGAFAIALGKNSVALGRGALVEQGADSAFALGVGSRTAGSDSVALGAVTRTEVGAVRSAAIGMGSVATEADTASFGNSRYQRRLVNVANGRNANDAATVGQLRGALSTLGGNMDANGNVTIPGFNVQGQQQNTINEALATLDSAVVTTRSRVDRVETQLRSVFQESPSIRGDGTAQLTLAGANGMVISNVANGLIAAGSREAVNGGQLHAAQQQLNGRIDGLEQRVDGQPQARAMATASAAPTEEIMPSPEASGSPQVASAGEGASPAPQPKSKKDDSPAPTPQVDTAELEKMLARANEYTDGAISNFERRLDKMDKRFNRMAAMSSAQTAMAMNTAGLATYNRLGAGVGYAEGESAMAVGYQRVLNDKGSATFSLNGAFTNSGERSMGVGVGIGW